MHAEMGGGYKQEKIFCCQPQSCSPISSWEGCWSHQPFPRQPAPNTSSWEQSPPGGAGTQRCLAVPTSSWVQGLRGHTGQPRAAARPTHAPPACGICSRLPEPRHSAAFTEPDPINSLGAPPELCRGLWGRVFAAGNICLGRTLLVCLLEPLAPTPRCSPSCPLHTTTGSLARHRVLPGSAAPALQQPAAAPRKGLEGWAGAAGGAGGCSRPWGESKAERLQLGDTVRAFATRTLQGPKA